MDSELIEVGVREPFADFPIFEWLVALHLLTLSMVIWLGGEQRVAVDYLAVTTMKGHESANKDPGAQTLFSDIPAMT